MQARWSVLIATTMFAVSSASWALPPVTLPPGAQCGYVGDGTSGFDAQAASLLPLLRMLGVSIPLPADWHDADLDADGIPDWMQLGLLGAVLCANDAGILAQYNANRTSYLDMISQLQWGFTNSLIVAGHMDTAGDDVLAWLDVSQAELGGATPRSLLPPDTVAEIELVGNSLVFASAHSIDFVNQYQSYIPLLAAFAPIFAAWGGLSSESDEAFQQVVNVDMLGGIAQTGSELFQLRDACTLLAATAVPPMTIPLRVELTSIAGEIDTIATAMVNLTLPPFEIYGVAKGSGEPFSGAGDYNQNGDSNQQVYDNVVVKGGGGRPEFVAAVSGANPYYQGAPGLPVTGLSQLSLLAIACGLIGAKTICRITYSAASGR